MSGPRDIRGRFSPSVAVSFRRHRTLDLYWQHYSREEIAATLNITLDMVATYIRQGRTMGDHRAQPRLQKRVLAAQTRRAQIKEMAAHGIEPKKIADALHVHVGLVRLRLRESKDETGAQAGLSA